MKYNAVLKFAILIILFIGAIILSLFFRLDYENYRILLAYIRIPAIIKAIIAGSSLALAGSFMQSISKNPLSDPYLTGLSSGAGLFVVISILCFNGVNYSLFGFFGAILSAIFVIAVCGFSKFTVTKLILVGLSVNLFVGSIISFLILTNPEKAYQMTLVLTGGISNADTSNLILISTFLIVLLICALFAPKLNVFRLDSRLGFKNEKEVNCFSILFIILSALLTSLSVYCAGILGFLGIICPIFCKILLGYDARVLFFANILAGATLMLISNVIANNLFYPLTLPLGAVVSLIGAPIFIFFLLKKGVNFDN